MTGRVTGPLRSLSGHPADVLVAVADNPTCSSLGRRHSGFRWLIARLRKSAHPSAHAVTVRQLLQQTSGIAGIAGGPILKSAQDGTAEEAIAELRGDRLAGPSGETFHYSNANFVLAGLVVERTSGQPYGQYVQQRIFEPLGMRHSYFSVEHARPNGLAEGHRFWFGVSVSSGPTVRPGLLAAGYMISSVSDLGRYLSVYLNDGRTPDGEQIISSDALRTMLSPGPEATLGPWADGSRARYAMGW